mmetsp:Transcript_25283/g.50345  ORF Transcript_25283/g.50345 Transcript_25283/m.50345 type:complete len:387 (+) Transcript_25283:144-1304(+)|eukprot:CAMPEP_0194330764 /NCGR_PEP_ID=MMETSP0171-20130528/53132_1 /TAXON_ID=218684 /ORGANISM="Corethron pennatum, Strain L29A3" /LENGTH=386 /DNA_ID=CAMNT_0039091951 /DNA_START=87 /DNA_END=1247 /DNA_ORIENTATION=+
MKSSVLWAVLASILLRPAAALSVPPVRPGVRLRRTSATSAGPPPHVHAAVSGHRATASVRPARRLRDKAIGASALAALGATFAVLVRLSGAGLWRYYLAGGACACLSHALTTPIDVIKTRQQVDVDRVGARATARRIVREEGPTGLLAGLGPTAFGYLFEGALKFGAYESLKGPVHRLLAHLPVPLPAPTLAGLLLSGALSGAAAALVLCPMEALRIRLIAEPAYAEFGWCDGGLRMLEEEGPQGLVRGITAMLSKQVPYTVTKQVAFDYLAHALHKGTRVRWGATAAAQYQVLVVLLAAVLTSVLSCLASQPGDMLLSAVNAHRGTKRTRDFAQEIRKKDGIRGFFVGVHARLVHVGLMVTLQLLIYDTVKRMVGIAATGSNGLQ